MTQTDKGPDLPPSIQRLISRLIRAFAPERIVLFGSRAKGTTRADSDVDLLIIANLAGNPIHHLRRARQLAVHCFPPTDIAFASTAEVAEAASTKSLFLLSILATGVTLYSRYE